MSSEKLIDSFKHTMNEIATNEKLKQLTNDAKPHTKVYGAEINKVAKNNYKAEIIVEANTSFACAQKHVGDGKVAVLNFANPYNCGGGVQNGAMAQEECLCRSSNLYALISQEKLFDDYYKYHQILNNATFSDKAIYSKNVTVFKNDDVNPVLLPENDWFAVDVITCAAPYLPNCNHLSDAQLLSLFEKRIDNILNIALDNNVDILVLGAFGCGAFKNPPEIVAKAFSNSIKRNKKQFRKIFFAIKPTKDENCPNLTAFEKEFVVVKKQLVDVKDVQRNMGKMLEKTKDIATKAGETAKDAAVNTQKAIAETVDKISMTPEERKAIEQELLQESQAKTMDALYTIKNTYGKVVLEELGASPLELNKAKTDKVKTVFPIPKEQHLLWVDAEFDLRPSGIALTEKGVYIKTNVEVVDVKTHLDNLKSKMEKSDAVNLKQIEKSVLYFYAWAEFEPSWFIGDNAIENNALKVEKQCAKRFIDACTVLAFKKAKENKKIEEINLYNYKQDYSELVAEIAPVVSVGLQSAETAIFAEQKSFLNTRAGHGEMVEEATTLLDKLHGLDAKVVGRDNAKNGADRLVDGNIFIQSKYYKSAKSTLESSFDSVTKEYKYMKDGNPMQLEVPKDQYNKVVEEFKKKIADGKVPGVTDPKQAESIVREGRYTYKQAVNLTKPGTIESLTYDAMTGAVTSACALGITFVITSFLVWRKTGDLKLAVQSGMDAGIKVFGITFLNHILISQIARTGFTNSLIQPSEYLVSKLGPKTSTDIINALRRMSGKKVVGVASANKQFAKLLRSNVITSTITFAVFSIPDTYSLVTSKISASQYAKNISITIASMASSAGGTLAAGLATAKVAGATGTAVAGPVGTAVGIAGGLVGGAVGATVVSGVGNVLCENDTETLSRLLNMYVSCMITEYMLSQNETSELIELLGTIDKKAFANFFVELRQSEEQEEYVRKFLEPHFATVIENREQFKLPQDAELEKMVVAGG